MPKRGRKKREGQTEPRRRQPRHVHHHRKREDLEARLDEALQDTFPASDPIELSTYQD